MYCGPQEHLYGAGLYTFADIQVCLQVDQQNVMDVNLKKDRVTYWWGGAWYNATPAYEASFRTDVSVSESGQKVFETYGGSRIDSRSSEGIIASSKIPGCGFYSVTLTYDQTGPYWGEDRKISFGPKSYDITVPCP
ncbi:hypothetical protein [Streptomyces sp. NPDC051132]|uniref:hypothetical protein n=1 Tax=unclassified Streptomyces TaxID=2593676 RepID=UPI003418AAAB